MKLERAAEIAQDALIWLAGQPDELGRFLAASGATASDVRGSVDDVEFLGSVLDYLLEADARVLAFSAEHGLRPELAARARATLPGGDAPSWT